MIKKWMLLSAVMLVGTGVAAQEKQAVSPRQFAQPTLRILSAEGNAKYFHLESEKGLPTAPTNEPVAYIRRDGAERELIIENIYNYSTEKKDGDRRWETMSAEDVAKPAGLAAVPFERKGFYSLDSKKLPAVVLIPQWGLLKIEAFDERTDSVILKYKRVAPIGEKESGRK